MHSEGLQGRAHTTRYSGCQGDHIGVALTAEWYAIATPRGGNLTYHKCLFDLSHNISCLLLLDIELVIVIHESLLKLVDIG